jgi:hypothetical protein
MTAQKFEDQICTSSSTRKIWRSASFWLKGAVLIFRDRDAVDALKDAETLVEYCKLRCRDCGIRA